MYEIQGILVAIDIAHLQEVLGLTPHTDFFVNCRLSFADIVYLLKNGAEILTREVVSRSG